MRAASPAGRTASWCGWRSVIVPPPCPRRAQPEVPGWAEWASSAITTSPGARSAARWSMIEARSPSANRPAIAARPSAASTRSAPTTAASSTARAIFDRIRAAPEAAASVSHRCAPSPMARNAASASVRGLRPGLARPVPARVVRVVLVADRRAARHRQPVPGDLGRARGRCGR